MLQLSTVAADVRSGLSPELQQLCTPAAILEAVYGVDVVSWTCPACGSFYALSRYPDTRCECGRPLSRRCAQSPCTNLCEPGRADDGQWSEPPTVCFDCRANDVRALRAEALRDIVPEYLQACARQYAVHQHRAELDGVLQRWLEANCGRVDGERPWVVVWGEPGTGKSVALIRYLSAAYYGRGLVRSVFYATEEELVRAASTEWVRDEATRAPVYPDARRLLERCESAELLVLDEVGAATRLTDAQRATYIRVLKLRLDRGRPTLIATNREPEWDGKRYQVLSWLDTRADSRLAERGVVVRCTGLDLRRVAS